MVPTAGIELATYWLQVSCSTNWAKSACSLKVVAILSNILQDASYFLDFLWLF